MDYLTELKEIERIIDESKNSDQLRKIVLTVFSADSPFLMEPDEHYNIYSMVSGDIKKFENNLKKVSEDITSISNFIVKDIDNKISIVNEIIKKIGDEKDIKYAIDNYTYLRKDINKYLDKLRTSANTMLKALGAVKTMSSEDYYTVSSVEENLNESLFPIIPILAGAAIAMVPDIVTLIKDFKIKKFDLKKVANKLDRLVDNHLEVWAKADSNLETGLRSIGVNIKDSFEDRVIKDFGNYSKAWKRLIESIHYIDEIVKKVIGSDKKIKKGIENQLKIVGRGWKFEKFGNDDYQYKKKFGYYVHSFVKFFNNKNFMYDFLGGKKLKADLQIIKDIGSDEEVIYSKKNVLLNKKSLLRYIKLLDNRARKVK